MEGLILHNANKFGYVELDSDAHQKETGSGYLILALLWLLAGLVNHYSMVPIALASVLMIGCNTALLLHQDLLGILLIPFSTLGILVLVGEFKTRRLRSIVLDEIEIQKRT